MLNAEAPKQVRLEIHSGLFWLEIAFRLTLKRCCLFFMLQSINDRIIVARKCDELIDFQVQSISSGLEAKRRKKIDRLTRVDCKYWISSLLPIIVEFSHRAGDVRALET